MFNGDLLIHLAFHGLTAGLALLGGFLLQLQQGVGGLVLGLLGAAVLTIALVSARTFPDRWAAAPAGSARSRAVGSVLGGPAAA